MTRPTLVFIHGILGSPASFDEVRARLPGRRHYAVTLPGHDADRRAIPERFVDTADRIADELGACLGSAPVDIVGYSLGARVALSLCARHPSRFHRAVFVSGHTGLADEDARTARREEDESFARLVEDRGTAALVDAWEQRPIFATQRSLPQAIQAAQRAIRASHEPHAVAAAIRRLGLAEMPDYASALATLAPRVALLVGEHDEKFRGLAQGLVARTPGLVVEVVPDAGHNTLLEAPIATAALIDRLLDPHVHSAAHAPITKEQRP